MALLFALVLFGLGLFFIIKGGDVLVRSALSLNKVTGMSVVIIGATFVSVATTLPEVFVSMFAVSRGNHGIAVGNAIGAMICNIALVLGISLVAIPNAVSRREVFTKVLFLVGVTCLVFMFALNFEVSWYEGIILLGLFAVFLFMSARCMSTRSDICFETAQVSEVQNATWTKIITGFVVGQLLLCVGAFALVENGEALANMFGISETVIGFTVIAIGTSLPELVAAIISVKRKSGGLAVGTVLGANIINCTLLLGVCGVIGGMNGGGLPVSRETVWVALPVLFIMTCVAVLPIMLKRRTYRWQGVALFMMYAMYVTYLLIEQPL